LQKRENFLLLNLTRMILQDLPCGTRSFTEILRCWFTVFGYWEGQLDPDPSIIPPEVWSEKPNIFKVPSWVYDLFKEQKLKRGQVSAIIWGILWDYHSGRLPVIWSPGHEKLRNKVTRRTRRELFGLIPDDEGEQMAVQLVQFVGSPLARAESEAAKPEIPGPCPDGDPAPKPKKSHKKKTQEAVVTNQTQTPSLGVGLQPGIVDKSQVLAAEQPAFGGFNLGGLGTVIQEAVNKTPEAQLPSAQMDSGLLSEVLDRVKNLEVRTTQYIDEHLKILDSQSDQFKETAIDLENKVQEGFKTLNARLTIYSDTLSTLVGEFKALRESGISTPQASAQTQEAPTETPAQKKAREKKEAAQKAAEAPPAAATPEATSAPWGNPANFEAKYWGFLLQANAWPNGPVHIDKIIPMLQQQMASIKAPVCSSADIQAAFIQKGVLTPDFLTRPLSEIKSDPRCQ
jgi:hypothetical protein